ncbi:hypothetical protein H8356DRAFT_1358702 [Neocallimastix lanati (nom. inval.)]|nr:hypothetical protein H8356DRAFT_1358702 [Neocallimastix sp. JGI-2020a]
MINRLKNEETKILYSVLELRRVGITTPINITINNINSNNKRNNNRLNKNNKFKNYYCDIFCKINEHSTDYCKYNNKKTTHVHQSDSENEDDVHLYFTGNVTSIGYIQYKTNKKITEKGKKKNLHLVKGNKNFNFYLGALLSIALPRHCEEPTEVVYEYIKSFMNILKNNKFFGYSDSRLFSNIMENSYYKRRLPCQLQKQEFVSLTEYDENILILDTNLFKRKC